MFSLKSPRALISWLAVALVYIPWMVFAAPQAFVSSPWVFVCGIGLYWAIFLAWPLVARFVASRRV